MGGKGSGGVRSGEKKKQRKLSRWEISRRNQMSGGEKPRRKGGGRGRCLGKTTKVLVRGNLKWSSG